MFQHSADSSEPGIPGPAVPGQVPSGWGPPGGEAAGWGTPLPGAVAAGPPAPPARPAVGRRLLAWLVDFALVVTVAVLLGVFTFHRISGEVTSIGLAGAGVWDVLGSHGDVPGAAENIGLRLWHTAVRDVEQAFVGLTVFAFLYQFASVLWMRRTLGKALMGLRVTAIEPVPPGRRRAAVRAGVTAVTDVGLYALACCLLLEGDFVVAWLCWLLSGLIFLCNAVPTLFGTGRSVADRIAGTSVTGVQLYQSVANAAGKSRAAVTRAAGRLRRGSPVPPGLVPPGLVPGSPTPFPAPYAEPASSLPTGPAAPYGYADPSSPVPPGSAYAAPPGSAAPLPPPGFGPAVPDPAADFAGPSAPGFPPPSQGPAPWPTEPPAGPAGQPPH